MAILLITHDLGVVAAMAGDIVVTYACTVVEAGPAGDVLYRARYLYTEALLHPIPNLRIPRDQPLRVIPGLVPPLDQRPPGSRSAPRCAYAFDACDQEPSVLPNAIGPLAVQTALTIANAILLEAGLSFLGLGIQPPTPSLGLMLQEARSYIRTDAWFGVCPGLTVVAMVLSLNAVAAPWRDARTRAARRADCARAACEVHGRVAHENHARS
jgi:oligopeptide/dipeptide ABC transporter ATP-binding protein